LIKKKLKPGSYLLCVAPIISLFAKGEQGGFQNLPWPLFYKEGNGPIEKLEQPTRSKGANAARVRE
jgi:hypothetical protein